MHFTIDSLILAYTVVVIFLTGIVMLTRVDRTEPSDIIFTAERFVWGFVWLILLVLITFPEATYPYHRDVVLVARSLLGGTSTVILLWIFFVGRHPYDDYPNYSSRVWRFVRKICGSHDPRKS